MAPFFTYCISKFISWPPEGAKEKESRLEKSRKSPGRRYGTRRLKQEQELGLEKERKSPGRRYGTRRLPYDIKGFRSIQMKGKCIKLKLVLVDMHIEILHSLLYNWFVLSIEFSNLRRAHERYKRKHIQTRPSRNPSASKQWISKKQFS